MTEKVNNVGHFTSIMAHYMRSPGAIWPNGKIPFKIRNDLGHEEEIHAALEIIQDSTSITFQDLTENPMDVTEFVTFCPSNRNYSDPGRRPGGWQRNLIELIPNPSSSSVGVEGSALHEMCHKIGLFHEHQRADRDQFVQINFLNIAGKTTEFSITPTGIAKRLDPYDFESIMHYESNAFSKKPSLRTIEIKSADNEHFYEVMGQRDHLSEGDIKVIATMYGS